MPYLLYHTDDDDNDDDDNDDDDDDGNDNDDESLFAWLDSLFAWLELFTEAFSCCAVQEACPNLVASANVSCRGRFTPRFTFSDSNCLRCLAIHSASRRGLPRCCMLL